MALDLPQLTLDASPINDGLILPAFTVGDQVADGIVFPLIAINASEVTEGIRLPILGLTEATASTTTYEVSGGVQIKGGALIQAVLNGVPSYDPLVFSATGGVQVTGAADFVDVTVKTFVEYADGGVRVTGAAVDSVNWIEFRATGGVGISGEATTSTVDPAITTSINATLPTLSSSITATTPQPVGITARLTVPQASINAISGGDGAIRASITRPNANLTAVQAFTAGLAVTLPKPQSSITAHAGVNGTASIRLPAVAADLQAFQAVNATMSARLPRPQARIVVVGTTLQRLVMVTNLLTKAVTTYENYPFNSFAKIGDSYFAAGPDGLYRIEVDGNDDVTGPLPADRVAVDASFKFGELSFGSEQIKRVSDCYAAMRAEGDMTVRVYVDEQDPNEYTLSPEGVSRLKQRRSFVGKGARGKYWQFEVANTGGCDFDFDTINVAAVSTARRL